MNIGIMGAMPEEIDSLLSLINNVQIVQHGNRIYYVGKINENNVILVKSGVGKVASATTATSLITKFNAEKLIFTGVAGATQPEISIGDVIVSDKLYQHDMDARPLFPLHEIPYTNKTFFVADKALIEHAVKATNHLFYFLTEKISDDILIHFNIKKPKCFVGTIATGDQFISKFQHTKNILIEKNETLAVEMEGAAVAQVCCDYGIPFVVIRTISDKSDHNAQLDYPRFIQEIARHYSEHIIKTMFENIDY